MVNVIQPEYSLPPIENTPTLDLYIGLFLGILISSVLWYIYLNGREIINKNKLFY